MIKPNFLYIGPNKAGSTWIYEALRFHPQVFLSRAKELHYFDIYYSLGSSWYFKHFRGAKPHHRIVGEISHDYLYSEIACSRIASDLGKLRLLVCLREPVDRAFSEYLYMIKQGRVNKDTNFAEALRKYPSILEHGLYSGNIRRYYIQFGAETMVITKYDNLKLDPHSFYLDLCQKLGIDALIPQKFPQSEILSAAEPRNWVLARVAKGMAQKMRRAGLAETITLIKSQSWVQRVLYRTYSRDTHPKPASEMRNLLKRHYMRDVITLDREFLPGVAHLWGYE